MVLGEGTEGVDGSDESGEVVVWVGRVREEVVVDAVEEGREVDLTQLDEAR